jgi:hypothetical protein
MVPMHRLRRTALALALGEAVALAASASAFAQTTMQPTGAGATAVEKVQTQSNNGGDGAGRNGGASSAAEPKSPAGPTGGYSWRTKAAPRREHQPKQKIDPSRPQAKGPEFIVATDGTSHISVQLSQKVEVSTTVHAHTYTYELPNAQVAVPNDRNPLVTTHFSTPVSRIKLVARGKNARLVVELRESTPPQMQLRQLPNGSAILEISVAKPSGVVTPNSAHRKSSPPKTKPRG